MPYKHFIAALAATFLLCIGTISAQKAKEDPVLPTFEQLVANDAPKAYEFATKGQLNFDQLAFFVEYERANERNLEYVDALLGIYWKQLTAEEKLIPKHHNFLAEHSYYAYNADGSRYFYVPFVYLLKHQTAFKQAWGDSLFNAHLHDNLILSCAEIDCYAYINQTLSLAQRKAKVNAYIDTVKRYVPAYEPQLVAYYNHQCVYQKATEADKYFYWQNEYLSKYENSAHNLYIAARHVADYETNNNRRKNALVWINKAIAKEKQPIYDFTKAYLLTELGRKKEARQIINSYENKLEGIQEVFVSYYFVIANRLQ